MTDHSVTDLAALEALFGDVAPPSLTKETDSLHPVYVRWLAQARFALLATSGPRGLDVSPRGDAGPIVRIVDEQTLLLPERRGNNRIDSLRNLVADPRAGLLFMIPGVGETLRVRGRAQICRSASCALPSTRCSSNAPVRSCARGSGISRSTTPRAYRRRGRCWRRLPGARSMAARMTVRCHSGSANRSIDLEECPTGSNAKR